MKKEDERKDFGFETRAIHAGSIPDAITGARNTPIHHSTSYVFDDADHAASLFNLQTFGFIYSRITNPTVAVLEERIANLENGRAACAAGSGHAAQFLTFFTLLEPGDHFVASQNLYGGSITQFGTSFKRLGWNCTFANPLEAETFKKALTPKSKAIFIESVSNPSSIIGNIGEIGDIAHEAGIPLIVDNTMASPYLFKPIDHGADIVIHSTTKYLNGHGNSMGGVIVESGHFDWSQNKKFPSMTEPDDAYHGLTFYETFGDFGFTMRLRTVALRDFGPALSPTNAFMTITGIETLPLRMDRHVQNAETIAEWLEDHPAIDWVSYAGLRSSPSYINKKKYFRNGCGSVFTFGLKGGYQAGIKLVESCELISHLANVGDTRSLILHPASTTHRQLTKQQQISAGAGPDVIRISIGLETAADIIDDLNRGLQ